MARKMLHSSSSQDIMRLPPRTGDDVAPRTIKITPRGGEAAEKTDNTKKMRRIGEVAGGTAAECAVVCCCFPCTVMNLLVLAVVKLPACICRKANKHRKRLQKQRKEKALLCPPTTFATADELEAYIKRELGIIEEGEDHENASKKLHDNIDDFEREIWKQFYVNGFWRSPSQRSA